MYMYSSACAQPTRFVLDVVFVDGHTRLENERRGASMRSWAVWKHAHTQSV